MNIQPCAVAPDGSNIISVTIGDNQLQATVISFGACLQDLRLRNFDYPLVLGYADEADYTSNVSYFGAVVGRNANRIAQGRCHLNGQQLHLTKAANDQHQLHGVPHGHMGYPGNLDVQVTYTIEHHVLDIQIEACTDQTTLCNFLLHNYFNLDNSLTLTDHFLSVAAATYLPTDEGGIPLGHEASVRDTVYDFRQVKSLENLVTEPSLDHNFCITKKPGKVRALAELKSCSSGLSMQLLSTEAGLQVYNAAHVSVAAEKSLHGRSYSSYSGLAMEPQGWPNAANESTFPSTILHPREVYSQRTRYQFETKMD